VALLDVSLVSHVLAGTTGPCCLWDIGPFTELFRHTTYSFSNTTTYFTFYAFFSYFRIALWLMWLANSKRQPCFHPPQSQAQADTQNWQKTDKPEGKPVLCQRTLNSVFRAVLECMGSFTVTPCLRILFHSAFYMSRHCRRSRYCRPNNHTSYNAWWRIQTSKLLSPHSMSFCLLYRHIFYIFWDTW
jgi:hypothetical protein